MKIVLFGDSITDMARNRDVNAQVGEYGFGYPFFVAGELLSEDPKGYKIYNRGISGDRTVDLYARIKCFRKIFYQNREGRGAQGRFSGFRALKIDRDTLLCKNPYRK